MNGNIDKVGEPLVSIIVPVHKVEKYIHQCLDSLLGQTLKDIEIICIDDCSPDRCPEILDEYAKKDERIKVVHLEENLRQGGARNVGIRMARAEYVGFVDSDDFVQPEMYEELYRMAKSANSDLVFSDYLEFNKGNYIRRHSGPVCDVNVLSKEQRDREIISSGFFFWTAIIKKEIIVRNELFFQEKIIFEDNAVMLPWYLSCNTVRKVSGSYYCYRTDNVSSAMRMPKDDFRFFDRIKAGDILENNLRRLGLMERYAKELRSAFIVYYYVNTVYGALMRFSKFPLDEVVRVREGILRLYPDFSKWEIYSMRISARHKYVLFLLDCFGYNFGGRIVIIIRNFIRMLKK